MVLRSLHNPMAVLLDRGPKTSILKRTMATSETMVLLIDDDPSFRRSTEMLIESAGWSVQAFSSAEEFLRSRRPDVPACLVLDVRLPHLSGLDLQRELAKAGVQIPIIFAPGMETFR